MGNLYSHLVFRPPSVVSYESHNGFLRYVVPDAHGIPHVHRSELIWLQTALQVRIPVAWVRQPSAEYVVLYAHQNGEDLGRSIIDAHMLSHALNVDVLAFEYSGYGLSEKPRRAAHNPARFHDGRAVAPSLRDCDRRRAEPSEKACCCDIDAAYNYLTKQCDVDPSKIIIFGRSIGSGPAVYCASTRRVGGLVLIAPITSAVRVPLKKLNVTLPFIDTFPNIDRASKIRCPVLVVHGDMDELVPKLHGEQLFEKIKENGVAVKPLWIPTAKHNNVVEDFQSIVFGRCFKFLDELKSFARDRRSIEGDSWRRPSRGHYPPNHQFRKSRRLRRTVSCFRPPRVSVDHFSTCGYVGDDDRRSRDVRARGVYNTSLHDPVIYFETSSQTLAQSSQRVRYCGLPVERATAPQQCNTALSIVQGFCVRPEQNR